MAPRKRQTANGKRLRQRPGNGPARRTGAVLRHPYRRDWPNPELANRLGVRPMGSYRRFVRCLLALLIFFHLRASARAAETSWRRRW